jgi:hypothetical protein
MRFVVLIERKGVTTCYGLYRNFKRADADAKAIPPDKGSAYVLPLLPVHELP